MAFQINSKKSKYFRWHDSGDVQDLKHLLKIFKVCKLTPEVKHWMPTREAWIKKYMYRCPENLIVRFSGQMVDAAPVKSWAHTSTRARWWTQLQLNHGPTLQQLQRSLDNGLVQLLTKATFAAIAGRVGISQYLILHMVNIRKEKI
jgi:hypothetical protein